MKNHRVTESAQRDENGRISFDAERYSFVIAQGQIDLLFDVPFDVPHEQLEEVVEMVRERCRKNLVRHIAQSIAAALSNSQTEGVSNDRKSI
jgi:hypothetical protein